MKEPKQQNIVDALTRRQFVYGVEHPNARLIDLKAKEIRTQRAAGKSARILAQEFDISIVTVYGIVSGNRWKHLED